MESSLTVTPRPHVALPEVVILGASNVTYGLGVYVGTLKASFTQGGRFYIGDGHGRSYGRRSRALFRQLDGHAESPLWSIWNDVATESAPRYGLITDVGNDLIYGASVPTIMGWVEQCVRRLKSRGFEVTISTPPVHAIERLSRWRYETTSRMFFPKNAVSWDQMKASVRDLDVALRVLAEENNTALVHPSPHWYGFDPIHVRKRFRREAVASLLSAWPTGPEIVARTVNPLATLGLWRSRPARKWVGRRLIETLQPATIQGPHELWFI